MCKPTFFRDRVLSDLQENGYAVIDDVIPQSECDLYRQEFRAFHQAFDEADLPMLNFESIIHSYRIGHFETTWNVRLKVKKVFAEVWGTEKLLTSFDGIALSPPPEQGLFDTVATSKYSYTTLCKHFFFRDRVHVR